MKKILDLITEEMEQAFADAGFKLSGCCIWKKNASKRIGESDGD